MKTSILKIFVVCLFTLVTVVQPTRSYFTDTLTVSGVSFSMGDWTAPYVKIESPTNGDTVSGTVDIYGTVTDNDPHHYWLVIENSSGTVVTGPGTVNEPNSITNQLLFTWDTTTLPNGNYVIKLEARDGSGNKNPNLSPVTSDPEDPNDSVDWITVTVKNEAEEPEVKAGDVVINEVMWMGSDSSSDDEWIELRNMTDREIDVSNWGIENAVAGKGGHLEIPANHKIPAHGYFLIANKYADDKKSALHDTKVIVDLRATNINLDDDYKKNGALVLRDNDKNIIDQTPVPTSSAWPAGSKSGNVNKSMERNSTPGDGSLATSWHTCISDGCNDDTFWDTHDGNNFGTPKAANLSENDPTSPDFKPKSILSSTPTLHSEESNGENEQMNTDETSDSTNIDQSLQEQEESTNSANTKPEDLDQHNTDPNTTQPEVTQDTPTIPEETNVETEENMQNAESEETPSEQTTTEKQSEVETEENVPIHQETETQDS